MTVVELAKDVQGFQLPQAIMNQFDKIERFETAPKKVTTLVCKVTEPDGERMGKHTRVSEPPYLGWPGLFIRTARQVTSLPTRVKQSTAIA